MARRRRSFFFDNINKRLLMDTTKNTKDVKDDVDSAVVANTSVMTLTDVEDKISTELSDGGYATQTYVNTANSAMKTYVDTEVADIVNSAPSTLDTLDELAAALGDDANFATSTATSLGNRLRIDTDAQGLTSTQKTNVLTNLGITSTIAELNYVDGVTSNIQTQLNAKGTSNFSGSYNDLTNKPTIPTNTNQLTNGSGYITGITSSMVTTALGYTPGTSSFSGSYNDLSNKPTIPTNNNQLTNGSGYITVSNTDFFNNQNRGHNNQTNFNDTSLRAGVNYLQGGTNGPTGTAGHQWYGFRLGLGSQYGTQTGTSGHYASELYWSRKTQSSNNYYIYTRDMENGSWGSWQKMYAGYADSAGSVAWSNVTSAPAFITNGSNYNVNDPWLRENGDNADVKLYGNSRQMTFRTDGVSGGSGGHTGYPFRWSYGGDGSGNTEMLINTSGQLWLANYGWLHEAFLRKNATDTQTNTINMNGYFVGGADGNRHRGIYGNYNSYRINNIWSMGTSYKVDTNGGSFGNLYGMAYTYHNRVYTSSTMGQYHQMVWCENGNPRCALGRNVWTSGNVTAYSDIRVKENLEIIPNALEKVKKLNGYTFDRTDIETDNEGNTARKRQAGVVAQEVLEVLPEVVTGNENDPDGQLSVAYGNMVGLLIEAIKEQQEQIENLKTRLQ